MPLAGKELRNEFLLMAKCKNFFSQSKLLYPMQTLFVVGILFSRSPCVCPCVRASLCPSVRNVLFPQYLEESLLDFHQTLQTCSYMQDKYFKQKSKG